MKAIKMRIQKSSQWVAILLATIVAIITTAVVANATQTITTPNAVKITYSLAAGASSAAITPTTNTSVLLMGCETASGDLGVGQVSLLHSSLGFIEWAGLESYNGSVATTGGTTGAAGTHIVFIDAFHKVQIQTGASADTIVVHNGDTATRAGNVTLIW
jgi:type V secretory pathway adhesin AidA